MKINNYGLANNPPNDANLPSNPEASNSADSHYKIYLGSAYGGGWAAIITHGDENLPPVAGVWRGCNRKQGILIALIAALKAIPEGAVVQVRADKSLSKSINCWGPLARDRDWKKRGGGRWANQRFWAPILALGEKRGLFARAVEFRAGTDKACKLAASEVEKKAAEAVNSAVTS